MSIQKKSLISALQTARKAHIASAPLAESGDVKGTKGVKMVKAVRAVKMVKAVRAVKLAKFE
jgi:propanediol utilization protein